MTIIPFAERVTARAAINSVGCVASPQARSLGASSYQGRSAQDWSNQDIADFYHAQQVLRQQGVGVGIDRGVTDIGDPWLVLFDGDSQDVFVHIARIDGACILVSEALSLKLEATTVGDLIIAFETAIRGLVQDRSGVQSNVVMHPSARIMLSLAVLILLLKFEGTHKVASAEAEDQDAAVIAGLTASEPSPDTSGPEAAKLHEQADAAPVSELDTARKADILGRAQAFLARTVDQIAVDAPTTIASTAIASAAHLMLLAALTDLEATENFRDRSIADDDRDTVAAAAADDPDAATTDAHGTTFAAAVQDGAPADVSADDVTAQVGPDAVAHALFRPAEPDHSGLPQIDGAQQLALAAFEPSARGVPQVASQEIMAGAIVDEHSAADDAATDTAASDHDAAEAANQALVQAAASASAAEQTLDLDAVAERANVTPASSNEVAATSGALTNVLIAPDHAIQSARPSNSLDTSSANAGQSLGASLATQLISSFDGINFGTSRDALDIGLDILGPLSADGVADAADFQSTGLVADDAGGGLDTLGLLSADGVVDAADFQSTGLVADDAGGGLDHKEYATPDFPITMATLDSLLVFAGSVRTTEADSEGIGKTLANTFQLFGEHAEVEITGGNVLIEQEGAENLDPASLGVWVNTLSDYSQIIIVGQAAAIDGLHVAFG